MRLLRLDDAGQVVLTRNFRDGEIPPYTILSHTWGPDHEEVTFDDFRDGTGKTKPGYEKIRFCSQQSRRDGVEHFWIDTCCIHKGDLTELQEAINSMFRWYRAAEKCYVYLADVSARKRDSSGETQRVWESTLRESRWFTRGWTLQELVAPKVVEFFSRDGQLLGDKENLGKILEEITTIPPVALHGAALSSFDVPERMRWAQGRNTTKPEDRWYCLLGIFEVTTSLIYGEGEEKALSRLKDEIANRYKSMLDEIDLFTAGPYPLVASRPTPEPEARSKRRDAAERRSDLLKALTFAQMDSRQATIKTAYAKTCVWLRTHPKYLEWRDPDRLEQHHGFLWIMGKPGAGKSTLTKFAHADAQREKSGDEIVLSFFFNARGNVLEKSTLGMYRSVVSQLLNAATDLHSLLDDPRYQTAWTIESLQELLHAVMSGLGQRCVKIFIDALDECDEAEVQDMIMFFEDLGESFPGKSSIWFASRHYPTVFIKYGITLTLEYETGHAEDLSRYVKSHVRIKNPKMADEVQKRILEKANGIFMWTVLVIDIVNNEERRGRIQSVSKLFAGIPDKLSDVFKNILQHDGTNQDELLLCLQWILFAKRPLSPGEFYYAMMAGTNPDDDGLMERDRDVVTDENIVSFVHDCSKGLAELTEHTPRTLYLARVQFIHESVRDFLLADGGLYELWPGLKPDAEGVSHDRLKQTCYRYWTVDVKNDPANADLKDEGHLRNRQALYRRFPFLLYSVVEFFYHADQAAKTISQEAFLRWINESADATIPRIRRWINRNNLIQDRASDQFMGSASTLAVIFARKNLPRLFKTIHEQEPELGGQFSEPVDLFFHALEYNAWDVVRTLLELQSGEPCSDSLIDSVEVDRRETTVSCSYLRRVSRPLHWALDRGNEPLAYLLASMWEDSFHFRDQQFRTPLTMAVKLGYDRVVARMLSRSKFDLPRDEGINGNAICLALRTGRLAIVRSILAHSEDMGFRRDTAGRTALSHAAQYGHDDIVRSLLASPTGVTDERDDMGRNAISYAAEGGYEGTVRLLLPFSKHALSNQGYYRRTVISYAAAKGHAAVVRLLLTRPENQVNRGDRHGQTALGYAAESGHEDVVRLLLDNGATIHDLDDALARAAWHGHEDVVRLLLARGARPDIKFPSPNAYPVTCFTPVCCAVQRNRPSILQMLLENSVSDAWVERCSQAAVITAIQTESGTMLQMILSKIPKWHRDHDVGKQALINALHTCEALSTGEILSVHEFEILTQLLEHGAHVGDQDAEESGTKGLGPVFLQAAMGGSMKVVKLLLERGLRTDYSDEENMTALSWAAVNGQAEMIEELMQYGADREARQSNGMTLSMLAIVRGHEDAALTLLAHGADINARDNDSMTALLLVISRSRCQPSNHDLGTDRISVLSSLLEQDVGTDQTSRVSLLLEQGADTELADRFGHTPLYRAIERCELEIARLLLVHKADTEALINQAYTPLAYSAISGQLDVARLLLDHGADIEAHKSLVAPLFLATRFNRIEIVTLLLEHGARTECRDRDGVTPLMKAISNNSSSMARLLLDRGADISAVDNQGTPVSRWFSDSQLDPADFPELTAETPQSRIE